MITQFNDLLTKQKYHMNKTHKKVSGYCRPVDRTPAGTPGAYEFAVHTLKRHG